MKPDKAIYTVVQVATKGNLTIYNVIERKDYDDTDTQERGKAKRTGDQVGPARPGGDAVDGKDSG